MLIHVAAVVFALCCGANVAHASSVALIGTPPVERFKPDLDVYPQNFCVVQDPRGIVYVCHYSGVLEFDGERWQSIPMPNGDVVRSMAIGPDGTVYVGAYNAFGYLQRDRTGRNVFVDISAKFLPHLSNPEFEEIWDVLVAPEGVYFRALTELFLWESKSGATSHWSHPGRFGSIVRLNDKTLIQFRGEGLKVRDGAHWRLRPESKHLTTLIHTLVPLADGALLSLGADGKWWRIDETSVTPARMPRGMPLSSHYASGLQLRDNSVAIVSVEGIVTILDPSLRTKRDVKLESGYLSGICHTNDGGFLVSAQESIYRVAWPTDWSVVGTEHGANGDFEKLAQWNGEHYLMASGGALVLSRSASGAVFRRTAWGTESNYDLIGLDRRRALLATAYRLQVIEDGRVRDVSPEIIYPRNFTRSRFRPQQIFVGTANGMRLVDSSTPTIRLSAARPKETAVSVLSVVERGATEVWIGTERHGAWRYTLSSTGAITAAERFGVDHGLSFGKIAETVVSAHPDGSLLVSTRKGLFRFDGERFVATELGGLAALRTPDDLLSLVFTLNGDHWAHGALRVYHQPKGGAWQQREVSSFRRGAINSAHVDSSGQIVFICTNALLIRHSDRVSEASPPSQVVLRQVLKMLPDGSSVGLPIDGAEPIHLKRGDFAVRFDFALPELVRAGFKRYQGRLIGVEEAYSDWGQTGRYTYSDLHAREYRLEVRATDSMGRISVLAPFTFTVDPPWTAEPWARVLAALLAIALGAVAVLLYVRQRTRRLEIEKAQLETKVDARTGELKDAIRRLDMMAHVDGLTGVPNRRRLDEYLDAVWATCAEQRKPLSLLAIDVDHFKEYNDRHGHLAGDELLRRLVHEVMSCLRRSEDLLARFGGEEFVVVLPRADLDVARPLAEAIRQRVEESGLAVTVSIGVCTVSPSPERPPTDLVANADEALYAAKHGGRNRVCVYGQTGVEAQLR